MFFLFLLQIFCVVSFTNLSYSNYFIRMKGKDNEIPYRSRNEMLSFVQLCMLHVTILKPRVNLLSGYHRNSQIENDYKKKVKIRYFKIINNGM